MSVVCPAFVQQRLQKEISKIVCVFKRKCGYNPLEFQCWIIWGHLCCPAPQAEENNLSSNSYKKKTDIGQTGSETKGYILLKTVAKPFFPRCKLWLGYLKKGKKKNKKNNNYIFRKCFLGGGVGWEEYYGLCNILVLFNLVWKRYLLICHKVKLSFLCVQMSCNNKVIIAVSK